MKTLSLLALVLLAFSGNSLLTRLALGEGLISAEMFSLVRLAAGALALGLIASLRGADPLPRFTDLPGIAALFGYVLSFSAAYLSMDAGVGALILFGFVQVTTIGSGAVRREPMGPLAMPGVAMAIAGLVYLLRPGGAVVAPLPAMLMAFAGVSWGAYTLLGRGTADPIGRTARNFVGAAALAVIPVLIVGAGAPAGGGLVLAALSGAVTSGLGYAVWYLVLPRLSSLTSGTTQLLVPPATAVIAAILLGEPITRMLIVGTVIILGGVGLTFIRTRPKKKRRAPGGTQR